MVVGAAESHPRPHARQPVTNTPLSPAVQAKPVAASGRGIAVPVKKGGVRKKGAAAATAPGAKPATSSRQRGPKKMDTE